MNWLGIFAWVSLVIFVVLAALRWFAGFEQLGQLPMVFAFIAIAINVYRFRKVGKANG